MTTPEPCLFIRLSTLTDDRFKSGPGFGQPYPSMTIQAVPEPLSAVLFVLAGIALTWQRGRSLGYG